jgi:glycosyltransferase involved in cell wall biosynthesis
VSATIVANVADEVYDGPTVTRAQRDRMLTATAAILGPDAATIDDAMDDYAVILRCLTLLSERIIDERRDDELWLLFTAMAGAMPGESDMEKGHEARERFTPGEFLDWFIAASGAPAVWGGGADGTMELVSDRVVVDVSSCARSDRHTGIQRVERETVPRWASVHRIVPVAWTHRDGAYRSLRPHERVRVLEWHTSVPGAVPEVVGTSETPHLIVPWHTRVVLLEVAGGRQATRLRALARFSGSDVSLIGYDLIPLTSPEYLPMDSGPDFLGYLGVVKHASVIAPISQSASEEFLGLVDAIVTQELPQPLVVTCELPVDIPVHAQVESSDAMRSQRSRHGNTPIVLCVGSHEPRKNHLAVLQAAERLWRSGIKFEMWFFGGGGWGTYFHVRARALARRGRPLVIRHAVSDQVLWDAIRRARFTVFPSLHEGFGLPVAESLAVGTPVITTEYGSTAEIAQGGGCLVVDPRDDAQIEDAMRLLLTDESAYNELRVGAASRKFDRTWDDYAAQLWDILVNTRASK